MIFCKSAIWIKIYCILLHLMRRRCMLAYLLENHCSISLHGFSPISNQILKGCSCIIFTDDCSNELLNCSCWSLSLSILLVLVVLFGQFDFHILHFHFHSLLFLVSFHFSIIYAGDSSIIYLFIYFLLFYFILHFHFPFNLVYFCSSAIDA